MRFGIFVLFPALTLLAGNAKADPMYWLRWEVDQQNAEEQVPFQFVSMVSGEGDNAYYYSDAVGYSVFSTKDGLNSEENTVDVMTRPADSFYFALYNLYGDQLNMVGRTGDIAFGDVESFIFEGDSTKISAVTTYKVDTFYAVPEPTGGMLLLLGLAALALRRKERHEVCVADGKGVKR